MKALIIALVLLVPSVYAQDHILEARKAALDLKASEFLDKMNLVIDFGKNKSIDVARLEALKSDFEGKLNEALQAVSKESLKLKESELRGIAKDFKKEVKDVFEDINELKAYLKSRKIELKDKKKTAEESRNKALILELDKRIEQLKSRIGEKGSKVDEFLLKRFEKEKFALIPSNLSPYENVTIGSNIEKAKGIFASIKDFFIEKTKELNEEEKTRTNSSEEDKE